MRNNEINKLLLLLVVFLVFSSYAQDTRSLSDKGNVLISGTINFANNFGNLYTVTEEGKGKITTIEAKPLVYYFIKKSFAIGGELSIRHMYIEELEMSTTQMGIGPKFAYFTKLGTAYPFLATSAYYLNNTITNSVNDGLGLAISGGMCAPFTGNAVFLIEAGYRWEKIFFDIEPLTGGTIFLNIGVGGIISPKLK